MGDRYFISVECECGFEDKDVYYAPTCSFTTWKCPKCDREVDLGEYTGISYEDASNLSILQQMVDSFKEKR